LGQPFIVEDRPGAGGILGTQQIVTAVPDGYTIGITNLSTLSLIPVINPEATYKPLGDLKHIAYIGGSPVVLAAHEATHVKTLHDVIAYANAPGHAFTFSSSGVRSDGHLMGVAIATALNLKAGTRTLQIYCGSADRRCRRSRTLLHLHAFFHFRIPARKYAAQHCCYLARTNT
jgi:tripartite-type tricarboxylate transporter receptor subunit TctC